MFQAIEPLIPWVVLAIGGGILLYISYLLVLMQWFRSLLSGLAIILAGTILFGALIFLPVGIIQLVRLLVFQTNPDPVLLNGAVIMTVASSIVLLVFGVISWTEEKGWHPVVREYLLAIVQRVHKSS